MNAHIALGVFCVVAAIAGAGVLFRYWPAPASSGRHRAPVAAIEPVPVPGLEPVEALVYETVRCPACRRKTKHVRFALGGLMCRSCPPGGRRDA